MPLRSLAVRTRSRRVLLRLAAGTALAYLAALVVLMALEDRLVYHPVLASRRWVDPPPGCEAHDVFLRSGDGTAIHSRWYPCGNSQGAVLVCHSRAANLSLVLTPEAVAEWHRETGQSLFIFDYPSYGRSGGSPSEAGCYAAAEAAYDWLVCERRVAPQRLLIFGRSLGSAVAVDLASRHPHRALVLVSPFPSLPEVAQRQWPVVPARLLMRNRFNSRAKIVNCAGPVLIVHGTRDREVPFSLGEELFAAANGPKRFVAVAGASHNDSVLAGFFPTLRRFLADSPAPAHSLPGR
jgi:fermentation-respiration switch protein FrsA (DUF1100 family)